MGESDAIIRLRAVVGLIRLTIIAMLLAWGISLILR
jgi:hypothetical protein